MSSIAQHELQSDLAIMDPVITETLVYRTLFKALSNQSHPAITDKLRFCSFRNSGNLAFQIRYSGVRLYVALTYNIGYDFSAV